MTTKERAKTVDKAIKMVWASLESHLDWTHTKIQSKGDGSNAFQKKCVKEYAELIVLLTKLY